MNKLFKYCAFIVAILSLPNVALYAQRYEKGLIDKTVAIVGNDMIMVSQIEDEIKMMAAEGYGTDANARCQVLENMMISKLFLNQAKIDSLTVNHDFVDMELNNWLSQIMSYLGGEKAVEQYFGKSIFKIRQERREALSEMSLTDDMRRKVSGAATQMTPSQIKSYFKDMPKDSLPIVSPQYQYRQVVLYPNREDAALQAKEQLLEIRERIIAGERFSTLAQIYSQDPGSSAKGGELGMVSKQLYWPEFSDVAMALRAGQVSSIVETPDGFHLIQMIERDGDMFNARHILRRPIYTAADREKAFNRLDSIKTQIDTGLVEFSMAARKYSEDPKSNMSGGVVVNPMTGSALLAVDELKPEDYEILKNMKEGDVSAPFESVDNEGRGNTIYKIVKLEKIIPSHVASFDTDFYVLQQEANNKVAMDAIIKFVKEKQATTYIVIDPMFHNCNFEYPGWIK